MSDGTQLPDKFASEAPLSDAERWQWMVADRANAEGMKHLLSLLIRGGTHNSIESFNGMVDRIIRSQRAALSPAKEPS